MGEPEEELPNGLPQERHEQPERRRDGDDDHDREERRGHQEQPVAASDRPATPGKSDGIDLIIDKLPRHGLIKPIPVRIAPLGDRVFVASTPDLDITVTGNSLSDALLLLKQQLESTYESLSNKVSTKDQERQLSQMRAFIQDSRVGKSGW